MHREDNNDLRSVFSEIEAELANFLYQRVSSGAAAQDIAHDLYLKICALADTAEINNGRAYLFRMAANMATDYLRTETRREQILKEVTPVWPYQRPATSPEEALLIRDELAAVDKALSEMPPKSRDIFYLCHLENCNQMEIAERVSLSPASVRKHMRNVSLKLQEMRAL